jgi:hypothetical protein
MRGTRARPLGPGPWPRRSPNILVFNLKNYNKYARMWELCLIADLLSWPFIDICLHYLDNFKV